MPRPDYLQVRVAAHEKRLIRRDAEANGLTICDYVALVCRNWRSLDLPLRVIPAPPVDPWVHPKDRKPPSE